MLTCAHTDSLLLTCLLATGHTVCIACKFDCLRTSEAALIFFTFWVEGALLFIPAGPAKGQKEAQVVAKGPDLPVAIR